MRRAATSMGMLVARPQRAENTMNRQIDVTRVRTSPKRRPIHPVNGCMTAAASMYELTAQVPSEVLTPRLPEMEGTETLTMVMSRISMKEDVAIAAVRNNSLPPCSGGYSNTAGCWGVSATWVARLVFDAEIAAHDRIRLGIRLVEVRYIHLRVAHRLIRRFLGQHRTVLVRGVHRHQRRQSDAQRRLRQIRIVHLNSHGYPLHHLDPVTRGVLRRQQREGRACPGGHAFHVSVIDEGAAVQIAAHFGRLTDAQMPQLYFLEVCVHPQCIQRNHRHHRLAGSDMLAQLNAALRH